VIDDDYYAVLQVHPDAEQEVIDAAYRQLMRKYHPDVAGGDSARAQALHERAKLINQAYAVLGDRAQRWLYDRSRAHPGPPRQPTYQAPAPSSTAPPAQPPASTVLVADDEPSPGWSPLRALAAGYYLLPGPYEWEPGSGRERLAALLVLPLGVAVWAVTTGRLHALLDAERLPFGVLAACAALLLCTFLAGRDLPRIALAAAPSLLQFSGALDGPLRTAHLPGWVAAGGVALVSLLISARLYVFGVLPTLAVCWALSQLV
jgi:hypothetical protein